MKYKTDEFPKYGDLVRGIPNHSDKPLSGIIVGHYEDAICILVLKPTGVGDTERLYGVADNFELLARNE